MLILIVILAILSLCGIGFRVADSVSDWVARRDLKRRVYQIFQ